ncbi:hypothetical protein AAY77_01100 [Providencia rettgeri]|nr:hypothetical protein AAY77_01100 [Providencia rettgeri]
MCFIEIQKFINIPDRYQKFYIILLVYNGKKQPSVTVAVYTSIGRKKQNQNDEIAIKLYQWLFYVSIRFLYKYR